MAYFDRLHRENHAWRGSEPAGTVVASIAPTDSSTMLLGRQGAFPACRCGTPTRCRSMIGQRELRGASRVTRKHNFNDTLSAVDALRGGKSFCAAVVCPKRPICRIVSRGGYAPPASRTAMARTPWHAPVINASKIREHHRCRRRRAPIPEKRRFVPGITLAASDLP